MTVEEIRIERENRERIAAEIASTLPDGEDYFAIGHDVAKMVNGQIFTVHQCKSHWDACLVIIAKG